MNKNVYPASAVLLVDDEDVVLESLSGILRMAGIDNLICLRNSREVEGLLSKEKIAVLLLDLVMPGLSGEELLPRIKQIHPELPVIVVTGKNDLATAVECMKMGAFDYLVKAVESSKLIAAVERAVEIGELREENRELRTRFLSDKVTHPEAFAEIVTVNPRMKSVFLYMEAIAPTNKSVLITGETGVGKELIGRALHTLSGRDGPYVAVNIASFDDTMFSDTLFGHSKGAFTGAEKPSEGLVTRAAAGTLFLDEIGELSQSCQVKLLRLIDNGEYLPLGSSFPKRSEARITVATNRDLEEAVESGSFRRDLYYRLRTHHVHIPPLREREDDLPVLVEHFLSQASGELGRERPETPPLLMQMLENYSFPGNIRELESLIYDALSISESGNLDCRRIGQLIGLQEMPQPPQQNRGGLVFLQTLPTIRQATVLLIEEALKRTGGNQSRAAIQLGITQQALSKRLRQKKEDSAGKS